MQFMAVLRRRVESFSEAQFAELLDAEALRVRELYGANVIRTAFSRGDVAGATLLLEVRDEADARATLASLPLFAREMLELQMLVPLLPYRGFAA